MTDVLERHNGYSVNTGACDAFPGEWVTAAVDQKTKERAFSDEPYKLIFYYFSLFYIWNCGGIVFEQRFTDCLCMFFDVVWHHICYSQDPSMMALFPQLPQIIYLKLCVED